MASRNRTDMTLRLLSPATALRHSHSRTRCPLPRMQLTTPQTADQARRHKRNIDHALPLTRLSVASPALDTTPTNECIVYHNFMSLLLAAAPSISSVARHALASSMHRVPVSLASALSSAANYFGPPTCIVGCTTLV